MDLIATHKGTLQKNYAHPSEHFFNALWDVFLAHKDCWLRPRSGQFKGPPANIIPIGTPTRQRRRYLTPPQQAEVEHQVRGSLASGVIRPSSSPWASPIHLVPKKDGTWRMVLDYREMNKRIQGDTYPLPLISEILHAASSHSYYICLDLNWGFWNLPLSEASKPITAFITHLGLYEFNVLPFGMKNSPGEFQWMSDHIWGHLYNQGVKCYIDDIVIYTNSFLSLLDNLESVLSAACKFGVYFNLKKCHLLPAEAKLLGHLVGPVGIRADPIRTEALTRIRPPTTWKEVLSFLSTCSYLRKFIPHYSDHVDPLRYLLRKSSLPSAWTPVHQRHFEALIAALQKSITLAPPRGSGPFLIFTDASSVAVGGVIFQVYSLPGEADSLHLISFFSRCLNDTEQRWDTRERECYAIKYALQHNSDMIQGHRIYIFTDHSSLQ